MRRAIVLVDHGSRIAEANAVVVSVARSLSSRLGPTADVRAAHQELASPTIDEAIDAAVAGGVAEIVVVPFFLAPGRHASEDVPRLAAAAVARHPGVRLRVTAPLGADVEGLAELTLGLVERPS